MSTPTPLQIAHPIGGDLTLENPIRAVIRVILPHHTIGLTKPAVVAVSVHDTTRVCELALTPRSPDDSLTLRAFDAFTEVYEDARRRERDLLIYVGDADTRAFLTAHAGMFPHTQFVTSLCTAAGATLRGIYRQAADMDDKVRVQAGKERKLERRDRHVAVYTDGSVSSRQLGCGMGIATTGGIVAAAANSTAPNIPVLAELLAIEMAVRQFRTERLTIHTDSRDAIELVEQYRRRGYRGPRRFGDVRADHQIGAVTRRIVDLCKGRPVKLTWVRGHAGNQYNEAADRAARTVRRASSYGLESATVSQVLDRIHDELVESPKPLPVAA